MSLVFAGEPQAAYLTAGALKPIHAVLMHGILVLPLLALVASWTPWSERRQLHITIAASILYLVLSAAVIAVTV